MAVTKLASEVTDADRPFICSREGSNGMVTLYYQGDVIPDLPLPPVPTCPLSVTNRQFRLALTRVGLRAAAEAYVAAGNQDLKDWWEYEPIMQRDHPLIAAAITELGKTPADADAVFTLAATL